MLECHNGFGVSSKVFDRRQKHKILDVKPADPTISIARNLPPHPKGARWFGKTFPTGDKYGKKIQTGDKYGEKIKSGDMYGKNPLRR